MATLVAALAGGIGGVIIGAKRSRSTLEALEETRGRREEELEARRAAREEEAQVRLSLGGVRMMLQYTLLTSAALERALSKERWWGDLGLPARPDEADVRAAAALLPNAVWFDAITAMGLIPRLAAVRAADLERNGGNMNLGTEAASSVRSLLERLESLNAALRDADAQFATTLGLESSPTDAPKTGVPDPAIL